MSDSRDITRWNRTGLSRFRYIDGNAVTWLETLRAALAEKFPGRWATMEDNGPIGGANAETPQQRAERSLAQYHAPRAATPDWGWEIARTFARACHLLGEHIDAFANEGYLPSATQWESLRRLLATIDYHPVAPSSASTFVALTASRPGLVEAGLALRHAPADGSPPIVFETLQAIDVDPSLNCLRAQPAVSSAPLAGSRFELEGKIAGLRAGQPIVLEEEPLADGAVRRSAHMLTAVTAGELGTEISIAPALGVVGDGGLLVRGRTTVYARPTERLTVLGPEASTVYVGRELELEQPPAGLRAGEWVRIGESGRAPFMARVEALRSNTVTLDPALERELALPATMVRFAALQPRTVAGDTVTVDGDYRFLEHQTVFSASGAAQFEVSKVEYDPVKTSTTMTLSGAFPGGTLLTPAPKASWRVRCPVIPISDTAELRATGPKASIPPGVAVVEGQLADTAEQCDLAWSTVAIATDFSTGTCSVRPREAWRGVADAVRRSGAGWLHAAFAIRARLRDWQISQAPIAGATVWIEGELPSSLHVGRLVAIEVDGRPEAALVTRVARIAGAALVLADPVPPGATSRSLRIFANVVRVGHGERRPERLLGSGDAGQASQSFILRDRDLATLVDRKFPRGVRADVTVRVEDRMWTQVPSMHDCGPADPVFTVHVTEDGSTVVAFGDGENGRRLPSGVDNVRASYRVGAGSRGNLSRGCLMLAGSHACLKAAHQPLAAAGGQSMQSADSMRSAVASVLTLDRAVSLGDMSDLAGQDGRIWQAQAFARTDSDDASALEVVVVPAGGGALEVADRAEIAASLMSKALPGVSVRVSNYQMVPLELEVVVDVEATAHDLAVVGAAARAALLDAFSLRRRRLGAHLYRSDVFDVIQSVPGAARSLCVLAGDPARTRLDARPGAVIHFDQEQPGLTVTVREYVT